MARPFAYMTRAALLASVSPVPLGPLLAAPAGPRFQWSKVEDPTRWDTVDPIIARMDEICRATERQYAARFEEFMLLPSIPGYYLEHALDGIPPPPHVERPLFRYIADPAPPADYVDEWGAQFTRTMTRAELLREFPKVS